MRLRNAFSTFFSAPILHFGFANVNGKNVIDETEQGNTGILSGQVAMQQFSPVCGFGLHFQNGALTVNPSKLNGLVKKEMTVVTWVKIESLSHVNIIYACAGGGVVQRLEVSPNGSIRWMYKPDAVQGIIFNIETEAVVSPGMFLLFKIEPIGSPFKQLMALVANEC